MLYVLDGELQGFCDDDQWVATSGSFVFVPRDHPHGFVVTSTKPARTLVIVGPSQLDRQIVANGTPGRMLISMIGNQSVGRSTEQVHRVLSQQRHH